MVYTQEEKERMDRLLAAFADYVASSPDMDVAYSDKTGYVRLITARDADAVFFHLESWDAMLDMFFFDLLCDYAASARTNGEVDYLGLFQRLLEYVGRLEQDAPRALEKLKSFIRKWMTQDKLP